VVARPQRANRGPESDPRGCPVAIHVHFTNKGRESAENFPSFRKASILNTENYEFSRRGNVKTATGFVSFFDQL
jgi:hypothetical protein